MAAKWRATLGRGARVATILILGASAAVGTARAQTPPWQFAGSNVENTRSNVSASGSQQLNTATASTLAVNWTYNTAGAISATPTVESGGVYVTDWAGMLYKLNPATGALIWSNPISYYTGVTPDGSRSSPAIGSQGEIVLGDTESATVFAVNRTTGALIWKTVVDADPLAFFHGSAVIYNGVVYIGVASTDEGAAKASATFVPTFRGSVVALSETTGAILWQVYMAPTGYTGAAIWNSQPVVFAAGNALIVATGNNYSVPPSVADCVLDAVGNLATQTSCLDPADHVDSVLSLNLANGSLNWSRKFQAVDTYNGACLAGFASCPDPAGADFDFASAPNLVSVPNFVGVPDDRGGTSNSYLLGAGQKSGMYWAINPYDGGLFWGNLVGQGQIKWGPAINIANNQVALIAVDNPSHFENICAGSPTVAPYQWNAGSWGALNLKTGKMIWQLPAYGNDLTNPSYGSSAPGPISFSNQVAFAASSSGYMVAFDSMRGNVLWTYDTGGQIQSAPAIFNDTLYWGTGYGDTAVGTLYAFSLASTIANAR